MEIIVNNTGDTKILKINYQVDESDFDAEFDEKIVKLAKFLGFDFSGSGYNHIKKLRQIVFEKNKDFKNLEILIADLENMVYPRPEPENDNKI